MINIPKLKPICLVSPIVFLLGCRLLQPFTTQISTEPVVHQRLSQDVKPLRYAIELSIDPHTPHYTGQVDIDLELAKAQTHLELHSKQLSVTTARIEQGDRSIGLEVSQITPSRIRLESPESLPKGTARLIINFHGRVSQTADGLYAVEDGGKPYVFTQLEPIAARRVFPCFDEPRFKTPIQLTLEVPSDFLAVANAPEVSKEQKGAKMRFTFKETKPLPTYLLAFGIGDFDIIESEWKVDNLHSFRIVVPKGKLEHVRYAMEQTPLVYQAIKDYLGQSYPYQKLDFLAVPNFQAGAMENPGLITFREALLLADPATASPSTLVSVRSIIAHELAHMWFGNSVTLKWWDDIWLNEAFATWVADRVEMTLSDQARVIRSVARSKQRVMRADQKASVRAVRQHIESDGDIENAFDGITYRKGASLLWMLERWLGKENLQQAIQRYLNTFRHQAVVTADLLRVLNETTGKSVESVLSRFLDRPGYPDLTFDLDCGAQAPKLTVTQRSSRSNQSVKVPWHVPVCVRYGQRDGTMKTCFELKDGRGVIRLDGAHCPTWFFGNDGESGYYSWTVSESWLEQMLSQLEMLSSVERATLPPLLRRLAENGELSPKAYLRMLLILLEDPEPSVKSEVLGQMSYVGRVFSKTDAHRERFNRWLEPHLIALWKNLNEQTFDDQNVDGSRLKDQVRQMLGSDLEHQEFLEKGKAILSERLQVDAAQWSAEQQSWMLIGALQLTPEQGAVIQSRLGQERQSTARSTLIRALARSPVVAHRQKLRQSFLSGQLRSQDFWLIAAGRGWRDREERWTWVSAELERLRGVLTDGGFAALPWISRSGCSASEQAQVEAVFAPHLKEYPALVRNISLVSEDILNCARHREVWSKDFEAMFP